MREPKTIFTTDQGNDILWHMKNMLDAFRDDGIEFDDLPDDIMRGVVFAHVAVDAAPVVAELLGADWTRVMMAEAMAAEILVTYGYDEDAIRTTEGNIFLHFNPVTKEWMLAIQPNLLTED